MNKKLNGFVLYYLVQGDLDRIVEKCFKHNAHGSQPWAIGHELLKLSGELD